MRANRRRDTGPELAIRKELHRRGLRYRVDLSLVVDGVRTRPDIVFTKRRIAIYIDGCFWHSCPEHGQTPRANATYWRPKLAANVARDRRADEALLAAGWCVIRVWEHEHSVEAAERIAVALSTRDTS